MCFGRVLCVFVCALAATGFGVGCASDDMDDSGAYSDDQYYYPPPPVSSDAGSYPTADGLSSPDPLDQPLPGETYATYAENEFTDPAEDALATFSLDVDTGSYTLMRRDLTSGRAPTPQGVRVEEYLNYFDMGYAPPTEEDLAPFAVHLESAPSPFGEDLNLLRVGVKGYEVPEEARKPANLVFLIDVSGSMRASNKLGLVQTSLEALLNSLGPDDTVGIVVYAGRDATLLEPTPISERATILDAIYSLSSGGSTAGAAGIRRAYDLAGDHFVEGGINRVILCTDGDFNVGLTGEALLSEIERNRDRGITITTLGFGAGNFNDYQVEQIANRGNGNYAYIDRQDEALRVLSENITSTLQVIAKDVKVQVAFNPDLVSRYRLIGYDNRILDDDEFDDDTVDAAEIGSGHSVTALLEYELHDDLDEATGNVATVYLRHKQPEGTESVETLYEHALSDSRTDFDDATDATRFSAALAEYAEILRNSKHSTGREFGRVLEILESIDSGGIAGVDELIELVERAAGLR